MAKNVGNPKKGSNVDYDVKILEVKNLKKHFRVGAGRNAFTVPAVDDVSFDVYKREIFGLVGESGSGKTTTGRTIIKLYGATEGYVKLNEIQVSAGYMEYVRNIRHIRRKLRKDLISLDVYKQEAEDVKTKLRRDTRNLNFKIQELEQKYELDLLELEADILKYKKEIYELSEQNKLNLDSLSYNYVLSHDEIVNSTKNRYLEQYKEDLHIEKNKFKNKHSGLKDSAALSKADINRHIQDLRVEYEENIKALELEYQPLIARGNVETVNKDIAKDKIRDNKNRFRENRKKLKEKYQIDLELLEQRKPDFDKFKEDKKDLKLSYDLEINQIKAAIKQLQVDAKAEIHANKDKAKNNPLTVDEKESIKEKSKKLKEEAKIAVLEQKEQIAIAKEINKSKEALDASRKMQMIFQDPISSLNPRMTVREIIGEGLLISGEYTKEEINAKVADILQIVGLAPEFAMRYPHEFSGGQRQRIGIARALIMNPNFIIADEPISALDVSIQAQVINLISELKDELDLTVLFIAHDLSVVRFFCDRVAVMNQGKIVEMAETEELFRNPMHPYTKSLLSAIPQPDPDYEKGRKRTNYDPRMHDYRIDKPSLHEISPGHTVYANDKEFLQMKKEYQGNN